MKTKSTWLYAILLLVGMAFTQTLTAQTLIPAPGLYTTVPKGYQALSNVALSDTMTWFRWSQDSTQISISLKMLSASGKYKVKLARLYAAKAGGQIGLINEESLRPTDSTIYFYARSLNPGADLYLNIITEEFCPGCSPASCRANIAFAPEAAGCAYTQRTCDLVKDGDMEGFSQCSAIHVTGQAHPYNDWAACHWMLPNSLDGIVGTADYFNACAPSGLSNSSSLVNAWSMCQSISPHSLNGYSGISVYEATPAVPERREYIVNRLNAPMLAGKTYSISLWVRLANVSKYATNRISMLLTNNVPIQTTNGNIPMIISPSIGEYIPSFNGNAIITDKTSWTRLSLVYRPVTTNNFITIGNFNANAQTTITDLDLSNSWSYGAVGLNCANHGHYSYYYVDDVSIRPIDLNAGPDKSICPTQTVALVSSLTCPPTGGTVSYSWTPSGSLTTPGASSTIASPSVTTNYTLTAIITFTDGTAPIYLSDEVNVSVVDASFTLTASASPSIICSGSSSTLTANACACLNYTWTNGVNTYTVPNPVVSPTVTTTYTVSSIYCSRTLTAAVTVTVNPAPTFSLSSNMACEGSTVEVMTSSLTTINYIDFGEQFSTTNVINPHAYNSAGTYSITIDAHNSAGSCNTHTVIPITVVSSQSMTLTFTNTPCTNNYTFTANFGCTNNSYNNVFSVDPLGVTPDPQVGNDFPFTFPGPGTYTVNLISSFDDYGYMATSVITISNVVTPTVTASASPSVICAGQITTLSASGASTYTWQPGGATGSPVAFSPTATTIYTVTGTNSQGCPDTKTVAVTVNGLPSLSVTASPTAICAGSTTTLTASGASTYTWNTGQTAAAIVVVPSITTVYTVTGTNASGCTNTKTVVVNVTPNPTIGAVPSNYSICAGGSATLTASSGATSYSWNPGALTGSVVVVTPTITTTYTLFAAVPGCGTKTVTTQIFVSPLSITASASPTAVCSGKSATLTALGANTYTWNPGGLTGTSVVITSTVTGTTVYTVTGVNPYGCTATQTLSLVTNITPNILVTPSTGTICAASSYTIRALNAGTSFVWAPGSATTSSIIITPTSSIVYTVTGTNTTTGCSATQTAAVVVNPFTLVSANPSTICAGQTSTLSAQGAASYTWNTGANTSSITVSPTVTTAYTVTGTGSGCTVPLTLTLTVNPVPSLTATASPTAICSGQSATLTASGAASYTWNPGGATTNPLTVSPGSTTVYTVTGTSLGCSSTKTVSLNVSPTPTISVSGQTMTCIGFTPTLTASGASSYSWSTGATTNTISMTYTAPTTVNYTVTGTSGSCTSVKTIKVYFLTTPTITAIASPSTICAGGNATLIGFGGNSGSYTWQPGSVNVNPMQVIPSATSVYTVTAKNAGCSSSGTVQVTVNALPSLSVSVTPTLVCLGNTTLTASGANTYTWNPGATNSASLVVSPVATTMYTVTGTNTVGCSSTATVSVEKDSSYCCRPSVKTFTTGSISTQTNVTSLGAVLVEVTGTLTINTSSFDFTNTLIRMAPNAKLIVAPNCSVTLSSAHLFSCDNMWEGIELKDNSRLLANTATASPNTTLDDAHTGIYVDASGMANPAAIDLTDMILSKNRVGIKITNSSGSTAYPLSMSEVTLQGDVATPYSPGTTLKPYISAGGPVTYPSTEYGVQVANVEAITVGSSAAGSRNTFRKMQNGVRLEQSNAHVERCDFVDFGTAYNNKGIWAAGDLTSPSSPHGYVYYGTKHRFLVGLGTDNDCTFRNLKYGIFSDSTMTGYIENNSFRDINGTGIAVYRSNFIRGYELTPTQIAASDRDTTYIYNNSMAPLGAGANVMQNGVGIFESYYLKGLILGNTIDLKPAPGVWSEGVGIYHSATNYSSSYTTAGNLITGTGNYGVHEVNDASQDPGAIPRGIENNTITVGTGSCSSGYNTPNIGIYCVNGQYAIIKENTIDETSISGMPACVVGIGSDNGYADYIGCNLVKNTGLAIAVVLNNLNSVCRGNVLDQALAGVYLANGTMGDLGSSTSDAGQNEWIGNTYSSYVNNGTGSNIYYDGVANISNPRWPNNNIVTSVFPFGPVSATVATLGCTQYHRGGSSNLIQPNDNNNALVTDLINGNLQFPQYHEGLLWEHRNGILSLLKDSLLDNGNAVFRQFTQSQENTNLGKINTLMRSLGHYADVLAHKYSYRQSLEAISTTTNVVEQNYKLFMDTYIDYLAGEGNESAYSSMQQLAQQCPFSDGAVVYNARALMKLWGDETLYRNDCEAANPLFGAQSKISGIGTQNNKPESVQVYPNPNNGSFSIAYSFEQSGNEFVLYDLLGKEVKYLLLENSEGIKELNNIDLNNGIYYYKIQNGKNTLFSGKLVINK